MRSHNPVGEQKSNGTAQQSAGHAVGREMQSEVNPGKPDANGNWQQDRNKRGECMHPGRHHRKGGSRMSGRKRRVLKRPSLSIHEGKYLVGPKSRHTALSDSDGNVADRHCGKSLPADDVPRLRRDQSCGERKGQAK